MKYIKEILKSWQAYQDSGAAYGNTFEGWIEWLKDEMIRG